MFISSHVATRIPKRAGCALVVLATLLSVSHARARRSGLAVSNCAGCHSEPDAPTLSLDFDPPVPEPGGTVTLTLKISRANLGSAGFFLEAPALGQLQAIAGQPTTVSGAGAMHNSPVAAKAGIAEVALQWRAPNAPGGVVFEIAAVAANANGASSGDSATAQQFWLTWGCGNGITLYRDNDGDGIGAGAFGMAPGCEPRDGWAELDGDCDENDDAVHPGAPEICNEKDDDCNDETDEGTSPRLVYLDEDGDGFGARGGPSQEACTLPQGYAESADDCDDSAVDTHPGAVEVCNGLDDNCDDRTDEGARERCGVGWCERLAPSCDPGSCVPGDPSQELCNGVDDDCDGEIDEGEPCSIGSTCRDAACHDDEEESTSEGTAGSSTENGAGTTPPSTGPTTGTPPAQSASTPAPMDESSPTASAATSVSPSDRDGTGDPEPAVMVENESAAPSNADEELDTEGSCSFTPDIRHSKWFTALAALMLLRRRRAR